MAGEKSVPATTRPGAKKDGKKMPFPSKPKGGKKAKGGY